jgi:predicted ABC-type ATPase
VSFAECVGGRRQATESRRSFDRRVESFERAYRGLADAWAVYDNSGDVPRLLERGPALGLAWGH